MMSASRTLRRPCGFRWQLKVALPGIAWILRLCMPLRLLCNSTACVKHLYCITTPAAVLHIFTGLVLISSQLLRNMERSRGGRGQGGKQQSGLCREHALKPLDLVSQKQSVGQGLSTNQHLFVGTLAPGGCAVMHLNLANRLQGGAAEPLCRFACHPNRSLRFISQYLQGTSIYFC